MYKDFICTEIVSVCAMISDDDNMLGHKNYILDAKLVLITVWGGFEECGLFVYFLIHLSCLFGCLR